MYYLLPITYYLLISFWLTNGGFVLGRLLRGIVLRRLRLAIGWSSCCFTHTIHRHKATRLFDVVFCGTSVLNNGTEPCTFNFLMGFFKVGVYVRLTRPCACSKTALGCVNDSWWFCRRALHCRVISTRSDRKAKRCRLRSACLP